MEEMNIEQAVEIPDTPPERSRARHGQFIYGIGHRVNGPASNLPSRSNSHFDHVSENGRVKASITSETTANCSNSSSVSSSRRIDKGNRTSLFRKTVPNGVKPEFANPNHFLDKEKRKKTLVRAPELVVEDPVVDKMEGKGIAVVSNTDASKNSLAERTRYASKGKSIVVPDAKDCRSSTLSRRTSDNRRLVRNGCISPSNVARCTPTPTGSRATSSSASRLHTAILNVGPFEEREDHSYKGKGVILGVEAGNSVNGQAANSRSSLKNGTSLQERNLNKRDTKRSRVHLIQNNGECSTSNNNLATEVLVLGSSRRPSRSSPPLRRLNEEETIDFPEFDISTDDVVFLGDFKAISDQLEADERLAIQLQQEIYNEVDESLALSLQQSEDLFPSCIASRTTSRRARNIPAANLPRPPVSNRRLANRSTRAFSGRHLSVRRNYPSSSSNRSYAAAEISPVESFEFPFSMGLDMRLEVLEALEAAAGDASSLDMVSESRLLSVDRDFNENDYDMLSSLDELVAGGRKGLSAAQIRSLPESVVQVDDGDEPCSICLETPSKGDKIRHLLCMHKFHKDCVDVWLKKNKLCPICKSSAA